MKIRRPTDEEEAAIQRGIAADPDNPEWSAEDFAQLRPFPEVMKERAMATGYKQDFAAWATHQAKLLREKRFHELDLVNLIEEVGDIPHHMSRELEWHMESLLPAMLRWHCFEGLRNQQWQEKIGEHRTWIERVIEDSPSLIAEIPELIEHSWLSATLDVHKSLGLNFDLMPKTCPWTVEQILSIEGYYLPDEKGWRELP